MKVSGDWLSGPVQIIFELLADAGHAVFAVGGCVRNDLLSVPVNDIDLATDARPKKVMELGAQAGLKVVPTGIDHGTVTVVVDGQGFEVTTFRRDVETDGRRAVVAFSDDIETDARRRDFTINALYADRSGKIIDPLGGLGDIPSRQIRFIDDAQARIREDGLRTLRFFRFYAAYGDPNAGIDPDGLAAVASNLDMLDGLSAERIGAEVRKLLSTPDPSPAMSAMEMSGVLTRIMPGATTGGLAPLVHAESSRDPRWIRRLMVIGGQSVSDRLKLTKADLKAIAAISDILEQGFGTKLAGYKFGVDRAVDAALISCSLSGNVGGETVEELAEDGALKVFPIKAADLMPKVSPGPDLGALMRKLESAWIASDFRQTKAELLALIDRS